MKGSWTRSGVIPALSFWFVGRSIKPAMCELPHTIEVQHIQKCSFSNNYIDIILANDSGSIHDNLFLDPAITVNLAVCFYLPAKITDARTTRIILKNNPRLLQHVFQRDIRGGIEQVCKLQRVILGLGINPFSGIQKPPGLHIVPYFIREAFIFCSRVKHRNIRQPKHRSLVLINVKYIIRLFHSKTKNTNNSCFQFTNAQKSNGTTNDRL